MRWPADRGERGLRSVWERRAAQSLAGCSRFSIPLARARSADRRPSAAFRGAPGCPRNPTRSGAACWQSCWRLLAGCRRSGGRASRDSAALHSARGSVRRRISTLLRLFPEVRDRGRSSIARSQAAHHARKFSAWRDFREDAACASRFLGPNRRSSADFAPDSRRQWPSPDIPPSSASSLLQDARGICARLQRKHRPPFRPLGPKRSRGTSAKLQRRPSPRKT